MREVDKCAQLWRPVLARWPKHLGHVGADAHPLRLSRHFDAMR
jgi:hypothetical protein